MDLVKEFNDKLLILIESLAKIVNNKLIVNNIDLIKKNLKSNKLKLIETFIYYVLPYKEKIDNDDEEFFLNYEIDLEEDNRLIKDIFEFKNIWHLLTEENKLTIKNYLKYLCLISQNYFLENY
jgi:hypothetical protein